ncbi:hypothetical protein C8Q80DRAFT_1175411 [Daedaleopsis nitida]|nr:hypothetical protein C8Q80DRAFT_1175411 [Daedaleopsis nitida]
MPAGSFAPPVASDEALSAGSIPATGAGPTSAEVDAEFNAHIASKLAPPGLREEEARQVNL